MKEKYILIASLIILLCATAGFYYGINSRVKIVENDVLFLNGQLRNLKEDNKYINKNISNHWECTETVCRSTKDE